MAYRGSLRELSRAVFTIAAQFPDAIFYIVKHPAAKYYSLCDLTEFEKLTDERQPQNIRPVFCGTQGELLSMIKCNLDQLELFIPKAQAAELHREAMLNLTRTTPQQYDV